MAFDGTLKFDTAIDQSGFTAGLDKIGSIAKAGLAAVAAGAAAAGAAVVAVGKYAVDVGTGFESSMAQVAATMGITKDTIQDGVNSFDLLSEAAKAAGETTTFSASEAADALNYLALAGYSAEKAAEALPAVLDLAAASGMALADASDLATDAMAALGIEATKENLTHFGDQLAKTASKANTNVAQLGEAILTVGGTAKSLKGGTVELNAALGVLANRGIKGAEGGTALRNMILSLSAPTDKAAAKLAELGVSVLDADGNMRGLNEIFKDLGDSMDGLTDAQKTNVLNEIFNKVDLAKAQAMIAGCGDEFDDLTEALGGCDGAMADMAKTMNDTLEGDLKSLQSRAEALGISLYEGMTAPLRSLVQDAGGYLSDIKAAFENAKIGEGDLAGIASGLWTALGSDLVTGVSDGIREHAGEIMDTLVLTLVRIPDAAADILPSMVDVGASMLEGLSDGIQRRASLATHIGKTFMNRIIPGITDNLGGMLEAGAELLKTLLTGVKAAIPKVLEVAKTLIQTVTKALTDNLPELVVLAAEIIGTLIFGMIDMLPELVGVAVQLVTKLADFLGDNLDPLLTAAGAIITALGDALLQPEMLAAMIEAAGKLVVALAEGLTGDGMAALLDAVLMLNTALLELLLDPAFAGQLAETGATLLAALVKGLCTLGGAAAGELVLLFEEIGQVLGEQDWAALGASLINGILDGYNSVNFDSFGEIWLSGLEDIEAFFADAKTSCEEGAADLKQKIVDGLEKLPEDMLNIGKNIVTGLGNGILSMADWLGGTISGFSGGILDKFKNALGIQSPSKLMRDLIGKNLALGIGVGFTAEMPDIGEDAVRAVKDAFTLPTIKPELLMPELPMKDGMLQMQLDPEVLRLVQTAASMPIPVQAPAAQSIVNNYSYETTNNSSQTAVSGQMQQSGDIIIPVSIGGQMLDTIVVKALQSANAQSGGVTI